VKYAVDKNMNPVRNSINVANNVGNYAPSNNINKHVCANNLQNMQNNNKKPTNITTISLTNSMSNSQMLPPQNLLNPSSTNNSNTKSNNSGYQVKNKENTNMNIESQLYNLLNNKNKVKSSNTVNNINYNDNYPENNNHNQITKNNLSNNFFNNYNNNFKRDSFTSQNSVSLIRQPEFSQDEFLKLTERHEKLINKILIEEESYVENHRKHVDEMVEIMKEVKYLINILYAGNE
jgi:hypothetical protein